MIRTDKATTKVIRGDNRKYRARVTIDYSSLRFDKSVQIFAPHAITGSIPDQIVDAGEMTIPDRLLTGQPAKNKVFPTTHNIYAEGGWRQRRQVNKSLVGYIGLLTDDDGAVVDSTGTITADTLAVRFSSRKLQQITLATHPERIITDAVITVQNTRLETVFEYQIAGNQETRLVIPCNAANARTISLTVSKGTPHKRIWISALTPSSVETYNDDDIVDLKLEVKKSQNKNATIGRICLTNITVTLFNKDRTFDFLNTKSPRYGSLRPDVLLQAELLLAGTAFKKNLGQFIVTSWEASEEGATVVIKAIDLIGAVKDVEINEAILDNTTAFDCFHLIAARMGFADNNIEESLKTIGLTLYAVSGKVGDLLNDLCEISQSILRVNDAGTGIIVRRMTTIRGVSRYPIRFFFDNEYSSSDKKGAGGQNPNVLKAEYTIAEYERAEIIDLNTRVEILYGAMPIRTFPSQYHGIDTLERPTGAGVPPSYTNTFLKPDRYVRTEFSDDFFPEYMEFEALDNNLDDPDHITVNVWLFEAEDPDAQLTIAPIVYAPTETVLLEKTGNTIPVKPDNYLLPDVTITGTDPDSIEARNANNIPYEFEIKLDGKITLSTILPGNRSAPGRFEYIIARTGTGCMVKVWNYLNKAQDFSISLYGKRIIDGKNTKVLTLRDDASIAEHGEIIKSISLDGVASDAIAKSIIQSSARYYQTFSSGFQIIPWADPRIAFGDLIAYQSLRGYGYIEGIIEDMTVTYKGYLEQKVKLAESKKNNRDCRMFGSAIYRDRPYMNRETEGYV
jgi:hypothetical protein